MKRIILFGLLLLAGIASQAKEKDDSIKVLLKKGQIEKDAGRNKLALEYFQKAIAADPKLIDAHRTIGLLALETRQFDLARQSFLTVLESSPNDQVALEKVVNIFFSFRRWDEAIRYGQKMISLNAGQRMNYMIGKSFYEKEDYGQSFKYLEAAFKEEPKNVEIPTMFARALVDMSNFKAAVRYYNEAITLDSINTRLMNEMAMAYSAMNDEKSAVKYYELAMEKGYTVDNDFIENLSNSYIGAGIPDKGMDLLRKLLEKRPGDIDLLNNLADNYYKLGKYQEAINHWDKVLYLDKEAARALYMIGMCYNKMGDKSKGSTLCNKAIDMDPSLKQFRGVKGMPGGGS
jgi:tetratricopeptide (TPR) repeat protein